MVRRGCGGGGAPTETHKGTTRRPHRLHLQPLDGVFESHVIAHRVGMSKSAAALNHGTHGTVAWIMPVQVLPEHALLQRHLAQRTGHVKAGRVFVYRGQVLRVKQWLLLLLVMMVMG